MKPIIGIMATIGDMNESLNYTRLNNTYVISVSQAGGVPVILPPQLTEDEMVRIIEMCDGFLFSGGIDVTPSLYGEDAHEKLGETHYSMDLVQITLLKKVMEAKKPILGICRGHQVLNVACGGTLYQDLSETENLYIKHRQQTAWGNVSHTITIKEDSLLAKLLGKEVMVNSYHHQAVKQPGTNVEITAYSADGIVEAIEVKDYPFAIGVQWHPEIMEAFGDKSMHSLFQRLVEASS